MQDRLHIWEAYYTKGTLYIFASIWMLVSIWHINFFKFYRFTNVVCKWPGSTHDAFMLSHSNIPVLMQRLGEGWLLGDSGYPLKKWLMTPLQNPSTAKDMRYNAAHIKTRNIIERAFGVLKSRFRWNICRLHANVISELLDLNETVKFTKIYIILLSILPVVIYCN